VKIVYTILLLSMLVLAMALVVSADLSESYWVEKKIAYVEPYNIPDNWFYRDYTLIEVKYYPDNDTCTPESNYTVCEFKPESPRGFIGVVNNLPALYVEYEFIYDPSDEKAGSTPAIISLYHETPKSQYILSMYIIYMRDDPYWKVIMKVKTYKVNISSHEVELVDSTGLAFTQVSDRIKVFIKPTFYTKIVGEKSYLIYGYSGTFKGSSEEHSFQIAYDKVLLASSNQTFTDRVRESIDQVNKWYVWIGLGIVEYIPERSKINVYSANRSIVDHIWERVKIYNFRVEDWIVDHEKLFYQFIRGELPFYNEPTVENVYYYSSMFVKYIIPFFIGLALGIASMRIGGINKFEASLICIIVWVVFGVLFFGYTLQLTIGIIFCLAISFLTRIGGGESIHVEE